MSHTIVDGKKIADTALGRIANAVRASGATPHLAAIIAGADHALKKFISLKKKAAESAGIQFSSYEFSGDSKDEKSVLETINFLAADTTVHGVLVELPLPTGWDARQILDAIPVEKDVDVLSSFTQKRFYDSDFSVPHSSAPDGGQVVFHGDRVLLPPAVRAFEMLFEEYHIGISGKRIAVFGQGMLVGRPIAHWLQAKGAVVNRIDEHTQNPEEISANADIVISGVGKPGLVSALMVKEGSIVVDYGFGKKDGVMLGDVDFDAVSKKASLITPVPGGMGPLVITAVLENLLILVGK